MRRTDRRHPQNFAVDEFEPLVMGKDPDFSHAVILVGGEPSPADARDVITHHALKDIVVPGSLHMDFAV